MSAPGVLPSRLAHGNVAPNLSIGDLNTHTPENNNSLGGALAAEHNSAATADADVLATLRDNGFDADADDLDWASATMRPLPDVPKRDCARPPPPTSKDYATIENLLDTPLGKLALDDVEEQVAQLATHLLSKEDQQKKLQAHCTTLQGFADEGKPPSSLTFQPKETFLCSLKQHPERLAAITAKLADVAHGASMASLRVILREAQDLGALADKEMLLLAMEGKKDLKASLDARLCTAVTTRGAATLTTRATHATRVAPTKIPTESWVFDRRVWRQRCPSPCPPLCRRGWSARRGSAHARRNA